MSRDDTRRRRMRASHALATLGHRDFRHLWIGQALAFGGLQMMSVAIAWEMYIATGSPLAVGLLGAVRVAPLLAFSLAGGAVADLVDRRRVVASAQIAYTVLALVLVGALADTAVRVAVLYLVTAAAALGSAFDAPARQAMIPRLVPEPDLPNAFTLNTLMRQTAFIVGPGLGGLAIGQLGLVGAYSSCAVVLAFSLVPVLRMRPVPVSTAETPTWRMILGGIRYMRSDHLIPLVVGMDFVVAIFGSIGAAVALFPLFASDILRIGPEGLGLLYAAPSLGAVAGGLALGALGGASRPVSTMLAATVAQGLCLFLFAISQAFVLSLAMLFAMGVADVVGEVQRATIIQLRTPDEVRGRVTALASMFFLAGPNIGQVNLGLLASAGGTVVAAALGGAMVTAVALVVGRFSPLRGHLSWSLARRPI